MLFWDVINENIYENAMVRLPSVPFYRTLLLLRSVPGPVVKPLIIFPKKIKGFIIFTIYRSLMLVIIWIHFEIENTIKSSPFELSAPLAIRKKLACLDANQARSRHLTGNFSKINIWKGHFRDNFVALENFFRQIGKTNRLPIFENSSF